MSKFTGIILLIAIIAGIGLVYYIDGKDYLEGRSFHYSGNATVTAEQAVAVISNGHNVYYEGDISGLKLDENGLTTIYYDLYDEEKYDFLTAQPFSYFDTPILHDILSDLTWIIMFLFVVLGMPVLYACLKNPRQANIRLANISWYLSHPKSLFKGQKPPPDLFKDVVTQDIKINFEKSGIIALRTWKYLQKDGYLYSAGAGKMCWTSKIMRSDKAPTDNNSNGNYAFRLGCLRDFEFTSHILGIVSMTGEYREHGDGIIRAESCEILHLFVHKSLAKNAERLSSFYGVPVTVTDNNINQYCHWITSQNGIDCLMHNKNILTEAEYVHERACNT